MWGGGSPPHRSSYSLSLFDFVDFSFVHRFIEFLAFFQNLEFFRLLLDLDLDFGLGLGLGLGEGDEATGDEATRVSMRRCRSTVSLTVSSACETAAFCEKLKKSEK